MNTVTIEEFKNLIKSLIKIYKYERFEFKYAVMNRNGSIYLYKLKPEIDVRYCEWTLKTLDDKNNYSLFFIPPCPVIIINWKELCIEL